MEQDKFCLIKTRQPRRCYERKFLPVPYSRSVVPALVWCLVKMSSCTRGGKEEEMVVAASSILEEEEGKSG